MFHHDLTLRLTHHNDWSRTGFTSEDGVCSCCSCCDVVYFRSSNEDSCCPGSWVMTDSCSLLFMAELRKFKYFSPSPSSSIGKTSIWENIYVLNLKFRFQKCIKTFYFLFYIIIRNKFTSAEPASEQCA